MWQPNTINYSNNYATVSNRNAYLLNQNKTVNSNNSNFINTGFYGSSTTNQQPYMHTLKQKSGW